jgi:Primosomal protein N'' (replication factor Y) - superfamily II helicase
LADHLQELPVEYNVLEKDYGISISAIKTAEKNGLLKTTEVTKLRKPVGITPEQTTKLALTSEQQVAVDEISQAITKESAQTFLIEGVTGSGKTEVYLQTIEKSFTTRQDGFDASPRNFSDATNGQPSRGSFW